MRSRGGAAGGVPSPREAPDPLEPLGRLLRDLHSSPGGLSQREAALAPGQLATVAPFPFIVWGADELRRMLLRRRERRTQAG